MPLGYVAIQNCFGKINWKILNRHRIIKSPLKISHDEVIQYSDTEIPIFLNSDSGKFFIKIVFVPAYLLTSMNFTDSPFFCSAGLQIKMLAPIYKISNNI